MRHRMRWGEKGWGVPFHDDYEVCRTPPIWVCGTAPVKIRSGAFFISKCGCWWYSVCQYGPKCGITLFTVRSMLPKKWYTLWPCFLTVYRLLWSFSVLSVLNTWIRSDHAQILFMTHSRRLSGVIAENCERRCPSWDDFYYSLFVCPFKREFTNWLLSGQSGWWRRSNVCWWELLHGTRVRSAADRWMGSWSGQAGHVSHRQ